MTESHPRFDGKQAWSTLTDKQKNEIGALCLEQIVCRNGEDAYCDRFDEATVRAYRPFGTLGPLIDDLLMETVCTAIGDVVPALEDDSLPVPVPSALGQLCRVCRCSEFDPCEGGCGWAEPDLCTSCAGGNSVSSQPDPASPSAALPTHPS